MNLSKNMSGEKIELESLRVQNTLQDFEDNDKKVALQGILQSGKLKDKIQAIEEKRENINAIIDENRVERSLLYDEKIKAAMSTLDEMLKSVMQSEEFKTSDLKNMMSVIESLNKLQERSVKSLSEIKEESPNNVVVRFEPPKER